MQTDGDIMAGDAPKPLRELPVPEGFAEWLPPDLQFKLLLERSHGQWYATAEDFTIAGMGATPTAAVDDVLGLVHSYLIAHFEDDTSFEDAVRPLHLSPRVKVEALVGTLLHGLFRGATDRLAVPRERRVPSPHAEPAHCG